MGWLDNKHRRSEEEAERRQLEEIAKINKRKSEIGEQLSFPIDKEFDFENIYEFETLYLSDERECTDYITDTYRLAKPIKRKGYLYKVTYLSDRLFVKYKLRHPTNKIVLKSPSISYYGVPSIEPGILKLLGFNVSFYCIKSITEHIEVTLRDLYDVAQKYDFLKISKLYGNGKQYETFEDFHVAYQEEIEIHRNTGRKFFTFDAVAEADNGEVKDVYYMVPVK